MNASTDTWSDVLGSLKMQTTKSTFNTHLLGSELVSEFDDRLVVSVKTENSRQWLEHRMKPTVERAAAALLHRSVQVDFVAEKTAVSKQETVDDTPWFVGFEPYASNFVQVPRQFFEVVLRCEPPTVTAFVAGVIANTIGVIVNFNTNERREHWEASMADISKETGIKSRTSVVKAVAVARCKGYVIREKGGKHYRYRLRRIGEKIDACPKNEQSKK